MHEGSTLGSDGESIEVSPCTSDQTTYGTSATSNLPNDETIDSASKVKMRNKLNRQWTEVYF